MKMGPILEINAFWESDKPFPSEEKPDSKVGKVFHEEYVGEHRHLGWMDLVQLKELIKKHSISHIVLKNLEILGKAATISNEVKVCILYIDKHGHIVKSVPKDNFLSKYQPIYHSVETGGWNFSEDDDEIPARAKEYLRYLLITTKVKSVSCSTRKVKVTAYFDDDEKYQIVYQKIITF